MPKGKNCPNCGAAYEPEKNKCPYCGTSYYDMSAIDFENGEPFYLKIKTKVNGKTTYITQFVLPTLGEIALSADSNYVYGRYGEKVCSLYSDRTVNTDISFKAIEDKNGNLFTISIEE